MIRELLGKMFPMLNRKTQQIEIENCLTVSPELFYKKVAIETAINLIANTLSLAEFKTYEKGKEQKKSNYYLFNVRANVNQNAKEFWKRTIKNLIYNNEALVIMKNNELFVADEFTKTQYVFKENAYNNIQINNLNLKMTFTEKEVFYFTHNLENMISIINGMYEDYGKLIEFSKNNYKRSNARRGILTIPTNYPQTPKSQEDLQNLLSIKFKKFYEAEKGAVLPLTSGVTYTDLTNNTYKNGSDSRDIRQLIDDVFDYVGIAFGIPPQLLKSSNADSDKSWEAYMTNCIKPLITGIETEINTKFYTKQQFLDKTYLKIDYINIKYQDIAKLSNALDILTRNGINTLDDNLRMLGREEVGGELGNTRFTTLNNTTIEKAIEEGGSNGKQETN